MRSSLLLFVYCAITTVSIAQSGPCTETNIRSAIAKHEVTRIDDFYFFSGYYNEPVIGSAAMQAANQAHPQDRTNSSSPPRVITKIVAAPSGDMAYEYGTGHLSYDDTKLKIHRDFNTAYLRVWKAVGDKCQAAAMTMTPEYMDEQERQVGEAICKQQKSSSEARGTK